MSTAQCRLLVDARSRHFVAFLCGVGHRQGARRCATIQHLYFEEVRYVRIGLFAKACVGMLTSGSRLHAIGWGHSEPCFAVAFRSDGEGMVRYSCSRTECGYSDGKRLPRLRVETCAVTWPAREFRGSNCQRRNELAIICFLKAAARGRLILHAVAGVPWVTYLFRRPFVSP